MPLPLSLRRPTRKVNGPDSPLRSASTPTLLSRLRSSTFSRSKVSLLSSQAYDSVRSRTPPTLSPSLPDPPTTHSVVKDRVDARRRGRYLMTVEQRECLAGAEVLRICDPVTGIEELPVLDGELSQSGSDISFLEMIPESGSVISFESHESSSSLLRLPVIHQSSNRPDSTQNTSDRNERVQATKVDSREEAFSPFRKVTVRAKDFKQRTARDYATGSVRISSNAHPVPPSARPSHPRHGIAKSFELVNPSIFD